MNQAQHWDFTINEWSSLPFQTLLDNAFSQNPRIVYDVGACVGAWSYLVYTHYGEMPIAFEPYPPNFKALVENNDRRDLFCVPIPIGIFYGKEEAKAMWRGENIGAIFVEEVDTTMAHNTGELLSLRPLEEIGSTHKPDLVKLDVEGAELNIIENSTLLKTTPQIIVEWHYTGQMDASEFFAEHLPHKVVDSIEDGMFLLRL